jgi:hypothetical protein
MTLASLARRLAILSALVFSTRRSDGATDGPARAHSRFRRIWAGRLRSFSFLWSERWPPAYRPVEIIGTEIL